MRKIVIVGGGYSGLRLVEEIVALKNREIEISLIDENPDLLQNANHHYDHRFLGPQTVLHSKQWYRDHNVKVMLGQRARQVQRETKRLVLENHVSLDYDTLVLAIGSKSELFNPNEAGWRRTLGAYRLPKWHMMEELVDSSAIALVVGGGLAGIQVALKLASLKIQTHLFEARNNLLPDETDAHVLDAKAAQTLAETIKRAGVEVHLAQKVISLAEPASVLMSKPISVPSSQGVTAMLENGGTCHGDMAVVAAFDTARRDIEIDPPLPIGRYGWLVNSQRSSISDDHIYAIGRCAEVGVSLSLDMATLFTEAKLLAAIILESKSAAQPADWSLRLNSQGVDVALAISHQWCENDEREYLELENQAKRSYKKLTFSNGRLIAGVLIGDASQAGTLFHAIADRWNPADHSKILFGSGIAISVQELPTEPSTKICVCNSVTLGQINDSLASATCTGRGGDGSDLYATIVDKTRATTGCGSCVEQLKGIVRAFGSLDHTKNNALEPVLVGIQGGTNR